MGALHFLELDPLPDALRSGVSHKFDVYEQGGKLFIKISLAAPSGSSAALCLDGKTPYTASITADLLVTADQLKTIEQAMADARSRIGA